jgi:uncharacterized membrane protein
MSTKTVEIHRNEYLQEDGMLFVRTDGILETMAKIPLIVAGLIAVAIVLPIQASFGSTRALDLVIYSDGSTHVSSQIDVDPLDPDFELSLFGPSTDNFVATGENGFLLSSEIIGDKVSIDTFGSSSILINYDVHDLVSKEGRVWTFSFNSPSDYTLLMPENSVIVGMNALPNNMEIINEQTRLELSSGPSEINYIFAAPLQSIPEDLESPTDYTITLIVGPIVAVIVGILLILKMKKPKPSPLVANPEKTIENKQENKTVDTKTIFALRPEMRDDDKEIVKFISENDGQVLESELRKKFLQPRTTMWRAVKRLERLGVVDITKKDLQNMVKLKEKLEEEE